MTTQRKEITWVIALAVSLAAGVNGRADEARIIKQDEIQGLRYLWDYEEPPVLKGLSPVGWETILGDRGKAIECVVVDSKGWWRWQMPKGELNVGEQGKPTDLLLLRGLLSSTPGEIPGTDLVISENLARGMRFYNKMGVIRIVKMGGSTEHRADSVFGDMLRTLPDDSAVSVFGDLLRTLPDDFPDKLLTDPKQKELVLFVPYRERTAKLDHAFNKGQNDKAINLLISELATITPSK